MSAFWSDTQVLCICNIKIISLHYLCQIFRQIHKSYVLITRKSFWCITCITFSSPLQYLYISNLKLTQFITFIPCKFKKKKKLIRLSFFYNNTIFIINGRYLMKPLTHNSSSPPLIFSLVKKLNMKGEAVNKRVVGSVFNEKHKFALMEKSKIMRF